MLHLIKPNNLKIGDIGVYRCTLNNSKIPMAGHRNESQALEEQVLAIFLLNLCRLTYNCIKK